MRRRVPYALVAIAVVVSLLPSSLPSTTGGEDGGQAGPTVAVRAPAEDPAATRAWRTPPGVRWPAPGVVEVSTPAATAGAPPALTSTGESGVRIGSTDGRPARVRVETLDRAAARRAGVDGVLLRIDHLGGAGRSAIEIDYQPYRHAFGGDWGTRLRLVRLNGQVRTPVPAANDAAGGVVRAQVADGLYALTAASSGAAGSFAPTSLSPAAVWQAGLASGDFAWSYPLALPKVPGQTPNLALTYSSGSVDGQTAATNNQPSWAGNGFDLRAGFIERSYQSCADDGQAGVSDLCWGSANATVVLPGLTGELVRDDVTGVWRSERDAGWRVELLSGAANGDNDGEWWRLTSPDGTRYTFGGSGSSNSAWTVPVYGDDPGEPCHGSALSASWCQQGYRWNLDSVMDRHEDVVSFFYDQELNVYGRGGGTPTQYTRGGWLSRVEYGAGPGRPASARVMFAVADRCVSGSGCSPQDPQNWPDVPWDRACGLSSCPVPVPTFWTAKRLAAVTAHVNHDGSWRDTDRWTLNHTFPDNGDATSPGLWLQSIVHTGLVNGSVSEPPVTFAGALRENRVDATEGRPPMNKWRVGVIGNGTGGQIRLSYSAKACVRAALPVVDENNARCFPAYWGGDGSAATLDWFHKYVISQVAEEDLVGGSPVRLTQYDYVSTGVPDWHHDDPELVAATRKTWGQWRGYQKVRVRTGSPGAQTLTEHVFLRGMDDDLRANGSRRDVSVPDSRGGVIEDRPSWRGFARESSVYNGVGGAWVSTTIAEPVNIRLTARRARPSGALEAYLVEARSERTFTAVEAGAVRQGEVRYDYDSFGRLVSTSDAGDLDRSDDEICTRNSYLDNTIDWVIDRLSRTETVGASCAATASYPADLISDRRYSYDGADWGTAPTRGDLTRTEEAASWSGGVPSYVTVARTVTDPHGRPVEEFDAIGRRTLTAYTPAVGGPVTQIMVSNPLGHVTTTQVEPLRGTPRSTVDANGATTVTAHDPLGRLIAVWLPGRATSASANLRYTYQVRSDGPSITTTARLQASGAYLERHEFRDGLLRERQTQEPSPAGGRIVVDTRYDSRGNVASTGGPWRDSGAPGTSLLAVSDAELDSLTRYSYDGAGRRTAEILVSLGSERWRTTTTYRGDTVSVDPPEGGTATTTRYDIRGRTVERRDHIGTSPTGAYDVTRSTYTKGGQLATATDPAGNIWRYGYDLRGRQIRSEAPDSGVTTREYDAAGQLTSEVDALARTLRYSYDALGRRTSLAEGATTLATWSYDTAPQGRGRPATATRWQGSAAYTTAVSGYDPRGRPTGASVTIPAVETGLAGTYSTSYTYDEADQVATSVLPAVGGLAAETLRFGYDALGRPRSLSGLATYVYDTGYDDLGRVSTVAWGAPGSHVWRGFQYDPATGRPVLARTDRENAAAPSVASVSFGYDATGNVLSVADTPDGEVGDVQCFEYDYLRRLTTAFTPASGVCAATPTVAGLGGRAPYWHTYGYDRTGNRLTQTQRGLAGGDLTSTQVYPAAGQAQPHTLRSATIVGPAGARTDTYGYDAAASTTSRSVAGSTQTLSWNSEGRVSSVSTGATTTSYVYDADGQRLLRRDSGGTTLYLDGTEVRRSATGAVTATRHYQHGGEPVAVRGPGRLTFLATDLRGTSEIAIDASTLVVTRRHHLPFGAGRGPTVSWPSDRGFAGGIVDPTGLIHLGAREYDPQLGRFISLDPVVDHTRAQQANGFAYANNSPVTFVDPSGLDFDYFLCTAFGSMCYDGFVDSTQAMGDWYGTEINDDQGDWEDSYEEEYYEEEEEELPQYVWAERPCYGWGQCVTPRPYEWVEVEYETVEVPATQWGYSSSQPSWTVSLRDDCVTGDYTSVVCVLTAGSSVRQGQYSFGSHR